MGPAERPGGLLLQVPHAQLLLHQRRRVRVGQYTLRLQRRLQHPHVGDLGQAPGQHDGPREQVNLIPATH